MKLNLLVTLAVVIVGITFFGIHAAHQPWTAWRIAGIAIAAPAFAFICSVAHFAGTRLQRCGSQSDHAGNDGRIYSRIRNPIYVFGSLFILGMFIRMERP